MKLLLCLFTLVVLLAPAATTAEKPILCRGHFHSDADPIKQLARMSATHKNLGQWKERATAVRRQILTGAKLDPLPERTPLNAIIKKKRTYNGYSWECAAFDAR